MVKNKLAICLLALLTAGCTSASSVEKPSDAEFVFVYGDIWTFSKNIEIKYYDGNESFIGKEQYPVKTAYHAEWIGDDYYLLGGPAVRMNAETMGIEKIFNNPGAMEYISGSAEKGFLMDYGVMDLRDENSYFTKTIYDSEGNVIYSFESKGTVSFAAEDESILIYDCVPSAEDASVLTEIDFEGNVLSQETNDDMFLLFNLGDEPAAVNRSMNGYYLPRENKEYMSEDVSINIGNFRVWNDRIIRESDDRRLWIDWIDQEKLHSQEIILPEEGTVMSLGTVRNDQMIIECRDSDLEIYCALVNLQDLTVKKLSIAIPTEKKIQLIDAFVSNDLNRE